MSESKRWVVTTSGEQSLSEVKKNVKKAGFNIDQVLDEIGCITGTASDDVAHRLRALPGVADVSSEEPPINIGPPDAPVTW